MPPQQNQPPVTPNGQSAAAPPPPSTSSFADQPAPSPQQPYVSSQGEQPVGVGTFQQAGAPPRSAAPPPLQSPNYQNFQPQTPITPQQPSGQVPHMGRPQITQQPIPPQQSQQGFNQSQQFSTQLQQPVGMGQAGPGFSYPTEGKSGSKLKKILLISGGALVALASLGAGLLVALGGSNVTYDELSRTETSSSTSENISILHPTEMKEVLTGNTRLEFRHSDEESQGMISELSVEGIFYGASYLTDEVRNGFVDDMLDPTSEVYSDYTNALGETIDRRKNFTIGDFRELELTDGKLAKVALVADTRFELPLATDQTQYVPAKGMVIFIIGDETLYIVGLQAIEEVYNANKDVFREMAKSIEVE